MTLKLRVFALALGLTIFLAGGISTAAPASAQEGSPVSTERPFRLPFDQPAGLETWLMAQPYGNTTGAYRQRFTTYGASGGIHFGLDLSAPCGTEIVAIADGIVFAVDGPFGSPPHNLMIDHPQYGYASMYGHLLEAPDLRPGDIVKAGQVIALTGDTGETCYSRPHLHLEIRDLKHITKYNPATLIEANWDNLALMGNAGRDFARDLTEPRKWQTLYDQPQASTGGPIVNDFEYPWPFDWSRSAVASLTPVGLVGLDWIANQPREVPLLARSTVGRQITAGNCCTQFYWSHDSRQVRFLDRPGPGLPLGLWGVDLTRPEPRPELVTERLGIYSPDGSLVAYPNRNKGVAVVERLADGQTWEIDTQENSLSFMPDGRHVIWTVEDEERFSDNREETIWIANTDGSEARILLQTRRTNVIAWLTEAMWLMTRRIPGGSDQQLFILSLANGRETELAQLPRSRGMLLSPDRRYLVYYVTFEREAAKNGLWLLDLQSPRPEPQKLPFFGAYRWRDNNRLVYVPFDPEAIEHNFYEYNVRTGRTRALFPEGTKLIIANNEWRISPDGRQIALAAARDMELDGVWVLELP